MRERMIIAKQELVLGIPCPHPLPPPVSWIAEIHAVPRLPRSFGTSS